MQRTFTYKALVINVKPIGENNSSITLLTEEKGIIHAVLYGGPKSKMKSLVALWNFGNIWLYENPEKNQIKITDFEVLKYHQTFGESLYKNFAASLVCELALKTHCAGSNSQCFKLVNGFFDGMEICDDNQSKVGLMRFLWRFVELLGIQPQTLECSFCGCSFFDISAGMNTLTFYNCRENAFICADCYASTQNKNDFLPLNTNALIYLNAVTSLSPSQVRKMQIDKEEYEQIKQILFFLLQNSIEQKINSIETGIGIL